MSALARQIIEAALDGKPVDVRTAVNEAITENATAIVESFKPEFGNAVMYQDEEIVDEDLVEFFEQFHADHGHLPEDEQLELMAEFEQKIQEEDAQLDEDLNEFFEQFHAEYGHLPEDEQLELMAEFEEQAMADDNRPLTQPLDPAAARRRERKKRFVNRVFAPNAPNAPNASKDNV